MTWTEARGRVAVRERSQGRCETCGRQDAHGVHHRQPRSAGGTWHPANLLDLCGDGVRGCHGAVEAHVDPFTGEPVDTYAMGWHVRRCAHLVLNPRDVAVRLAHPVYGPGWWTIDDAGGLRWVAPWQPPRALEQLPTHKTGRVVRR